MGKKALGVVIGILLAGIISGTAMAGKEGPVTWTIKTYSTAIK